MSEHIYLLTIYLPIAAIILVFGMRYFAATLQAKARLDHEGAIAGSRKGGRVQSDTAAALASLQSALSDATMRLGRHRDGAEDRRVVISKGGRAWIWTSLKSAAHATAARCVSCEAD